MITESTIILAIIGMVGLFATATVFQRANRLSGKYYASKVNRNVEETFAEMYDEQGTNM